MCIPWREWCVLVTTHTGRCCRCTWLLRSSVAKATRAFVCCSTRACTVLLCTDMLSSPGSLHTVHCATVCNCELYYSLQVVSVSLATAPHLPIPPKRHRGHVVQLRCSYRDRYACDVWSTGVVLFQILYGHAPFKGKGLAQLFHSIQVRAHWQVHTGSVARPT